MLATAAVALCVGLFGTRFLIRWFRSHGIGQPIHDAIAQHASKAGTPSMGGLTIAVAAPLGYGLGLVVLGQPPSRTGIVLVTAIVAASAVGAIDDWMKLTRGRNTLGLQEMQKSVLILALGLLVVSQSPSGSAAAPPRPSHDANRSSSFRHPRGSCG